MKKIIKILTFLGEIIAILLLVSPIVIIIVNNSFTSKQDFYFFLVVSILYDFYYSRVIIKNYEMKSEYENYLKNVKEIENKSYSTNATSEELLAFRRKYIDDIMIKYFK